MRRKTVKAMVKMKSSVEAMMRMKFLLNFNKEEYYRSYDEDVRLCRGYDDEENCVETMKMNCGLGVGCLFLLHISRGEIGLHSKQLQTYKFADFV
jgi:hypothetical protein